MTWATRGLDVAAGPRGGRGGSAVVLVDDLGGLTRLYSGPLCPGPAVIEQFFISSEFIFDVDVLWAPLVVSQPALRVDPATVEDARRAGFSMLPGSVNGAGSFLMRFPRVTLVRGAWWPRLRVELQAWAPALFIDESAKIAAQGWELGVSYTLLR